MTWSGLGVVSPKRHLAVAGKYYGPDYLFGRHSPMGLIRRHYGAVGSCLRTGPPKRTRFRLKPAADRELVPGRAAGEVGRHDCVFQIMRAEAAHHLYHTPLTTT